MKKFKFKLESVLNYKVRLFEIAQTEHAAVLNQLRDEEEKLGALRADYGSCLDELAGKTKGKFKIKDLGGYYRYLSALKSEISVQSKVVCQIMDKEQKLREKLIKASQEKEALVKLKEKAYKKYMYEFRREEQNFLDELNSMGREKKSERVLS